MADLAHADPSEARRLIREGAWDRPTTGLCLGFVQANLAVLPRELAAEFQAACEPHPAGRFRGPMVVSMRPIHRAQLDLARRVTAELPLAHGEPVHIGDPEKIGITDLGRPD